jgi:hypothetical protein
MFMIFNIIGKVKKSHIMLISVQVNFYKLII